MTYQIARNLEKDLYEYGIHSPDELSSRYTSCVESLNLDNRQSTPPGCSQSRPEFTLFSDEKGPRQGWLALKNFGEFWQRDDALFELKTFSGRRENLDKRLNSLIADNPAEFFPLVSEEARQSAPLGRNDQPCMDLILKRMGQLLIQNRSDKTFCVPFRTPLLDELGGFLGLEEKISDIGALAGYPRVMVMEPRPLSLSFGLQMLVESYKSCECSEKQESHKEQKHDAPRTTTTTTTTTRSCRVQSLQFATDVGFQIA